MIDVTRLRQETDIVSLIERYVPSLKKNGKEFGGLCPFHNENTPSFTVVPQKHFYHCFGCGAHGDVIDFVQEIHGVDFKEACDILGGKDSPEIKPVAPRPIEEPEWTPICPVPKLAPSLFDENEDGQRIARLYNPKRAGTEKEWTSLRPQKVYEYTDSAKALMGYVLRCEFQDGGKFTPQVTFCSNKAGERRWCVVPLPELRPVYGLHLLAQRSNDPVMVVEGEKSADAANRLLPMYIVVSAAGGTNGIAHTDWRPLAGRDVLLWPDADAPGLACMLGYEKNSKKSLADLLRGQVKRLRYLDPAGKPDGWDAADAEAEGWDKRKTISWAKSVVKDVAPPAKSAPKPDPEPETKPRSPASQQPEHQPEPSPAQRQAAKPAPQRAKGPIGVVVTTSEGNTVKARKASEAPAESVPADLIGLWQTLGLTTNGRGAPYQNLDNVVRTLMMHPDLAGHIWYDEFHGRYFTDWRSDKPRQWEDVDALHLAVWFQRDVGLIKVGDDLAQRGVMTVGQLNKRDEPREWMNSLTWDGAHRLEDSLCRYFNAPDSAYIRAAAKNFWVSMVARVFDPGCQVDNMLVLESEQGRFKSSALGVIGGPWYAEAHESVTNKDFFMALQGVMLMEIAELDSFSRAETTKVKQVITCRADRYRVPYGRVSNSHPRRNIFVGTTNQDAYLMDATGARRFWPVKCGILDLNGLRDDRSQLFAEAVHAYKFGTSWWEIPEIEARDTQESRRSSDVWEDRIEEFLEGRNFVTIHEVIEMGLNIELNKVDRRIQNRVADALRVLGYERSVTKLKTREGFQSQRGWRKKVSDRIPFDDR